MDVMRTPPHSTSPVAYFGEEAFLWAPKKPREYRKPPLRSGRKTSSRSLDFSAILVQEDDNERSRLLGSNESIQTGVRRRKSRNETPIFFRNLNSPSHSRDSPLAFENIARRIDFASPSLAAPGQERATDINDSSPVFSPGLSPTARGILSQLRRPSNKRPSQEGHSTTRPPDQLTPGSSSPQKRPRWTRLIR